MGPIIRYKRKSSYWILTFLVCISSNAFAQQWVHYNITNSSIPFDQVWPIAIDNDGDKWFGFDFGGGVCEFNNTSWINHPSSSGAPGSVSHLEFDNNNNLWAADICSPGTVWRFDGTLWTTFDHISAPFSIYDMVSEIYTDNNNNIWFCTSESGLLKFDGTSWIVYNPANSSIPSYWTTSVTQDNNGIYWIGTSPYWNGSSLIGGGLASFDGVLFTIFDTLNSAIPANAVYNVRCDNINQVWFQSGYGMTVFTNNSFTQYTTANSPLSCDTVLSFEIANNNTIWAGTPQGLIKFNITNSILFPVLNADTVKWVNDIEIDNSNNIWLTYGAHYPVGCYTGHGITAFNEAQIMNAPHNGLFDNAIALNIYPNPMSSFAVVEIAGNYISIDLIFYDQLGREVKRMENITESEFELYRDGLSDGMYFYKLFSSNDNKPVATGKIVIQ